MRFLIRMGGIALLIATVLLLEGWVRGTFSWAAVLFLLPACALGAAGLLAAGARDAKRRRRVLPGTRPQAAHRPAAARAALRLAPPLYDPNGPWAA